MDDDDDDTAKGLRLFPLFLERRGWSFDWEADDSEEEEEEESSNGSSSRERGPPANWNSSDVVEGVRYGGRQRNISAWSSLTNECFERINTNQRRSKHFSHA